MVRCMSVSWLPDQLDWLLMADNIAGEVAEWSIALGLKPSEPKGSESSNLSLSVC